MGSIVFLYLQSGFEIGVGEGFVEFELLSFLDEYVREGHTVAGACVTDGSQLVLRAGIKAGKAGSYRLAAWVLEDGIVGKQQNYMAKDEFGQQLHRHSCQLFRGIQLQRVKAVSLLLKRPGLPAAFFIRLQ